jgi:N-acetylmuramoyl-L-alanine amidase
MRPWRRAVLAALALAVLYSPAARAGDTNGAGGPARHAAACARAATFRTVVDIGHAADAPGARSAHGVYEYDFNYRLAGEIDKALRAAGFDKTVLMVTAEAPTAGLFRRVARANAMKADLFLAVHHDAVPDNLIQTWQFEGRQEQYNDDFPGHSIFVSNLNADRAGSLAFAKQLGLALKARGLKYTPHYTEKFMGNRRRELVDAQAGVYRYDQLVVLKSTKMPAALLESGSIVNRTEDLLLATPEHQRIVAAAVVEAVDGFCATRAKPSPVPVAAKKP